MRKPKPCPWCGQRPKVYKTSERAGNLWSVECPGWCPVSPRTAQYETREEAVETWNDRRTPTDKRTSTPAPREPSQGEER